MKDRVVIRLEPFDPFQQIFIFRGGMVEQTLGTTVDDVVTVSLNMMKKYGLNHMEFTGPKDYVQYYVNKIAAKNITNYNINNMVYTYISITGEREELCPSI